MAKFNSCLIAIFLITLTNCLAQSTMDSLLLKARSRSPQEYILLMKLKVMMEKSRLATESGSDSTFYRKLLSDLYQPQSNSSSKKEFEANMVKALNLKLVVRDSDFELSRLHIFKDTLLGVYKSSHTSSLPNEYFILNLTDTSHLTEFINYDLSYYVPPPPLIATVTDVFIFLGEVR
jgi:hypothetical protein